MYSIQEAEIVAKDLLSDSLEASSLVETLHKYFNNAV